MALHSFVNPAGVTNIAVLWDVSATQQPLANADDSQVACCMFLANIQPKYVILPDWSPVCRGEHQLDGPAAISLLLTLRGVQTVVLSSGSTPVIMLPTLGAQLLQNLSQAKSVAEATQVVRKSSHGLMVFGSLMHKASSK